MFRAVGNQNLLKANAFSLLMQKDSLVYGNKQKGL